MSSIVIKTAEQIDGIRKSAQLAAETLKYLEQFVVPGARTIDIDIIFWDKVELNSDHITIPHPRWMERSFVVRPLQELPFFGQISSWHKIPTSFTIEAVPV